ncbi:MAG: hypothetical protein AAF672_00475 [Pseudomonadota bacterium]
MRLLIASLCLIGCATASYADAQKALATALQLELNRLGCEAGQPDGAWGPASKRALGRYAEKIGASDLPAEPSDALLTQLRGENGRLCTLPPGVIAADDRSETAHLEAVKFSYSIWTTMPSKVASETTEYGVLRCEAGSGSTPRKCVWQ